MLEATESNKLPKGQSIGSSYTSGFCNGADLLVAHTGLEPVISALRGQRVNQLHQCATLDLGIIDVAHMGSQVGLEIVVSLLWQYIVLEAGYCPPVSSGRQYTFQRTILPPDVCTVTSSYAACVIYSASQFGSSSLIDKTRPKNK